MGEFFKPSTYWREQAHDPFKYYNTGHIVVIVLMFVLIAAIVIFRKRFGERFVKRYLAVSAIVWLGLEIFKITLFFITADRTQALQEVLPFYMCSLFMYMLPLAAFFKGKVKEIGEYTLVTLSMLAGFLTVIVTPALLNYPFFSFYALHSLLYHLFMAATGVMLVVSGYVKVEFKKCLYPMIVITILAAPAIFMNNLVDTDYMLMRYAWGVPLSQSVASALGQVPLIILMFFIYSALSVGMTSLDYLIQKKLIGKDASA